MAPPGGAETPICLHGQGQRIDHASQTDDGHKAAGARFRIDRGPAWAAADGMLPVSTAAELPLLARCAEARAWPTGPGTAKRRRVPASKLVERQRICRVPRNRHDLLLMQRPATARRTREDRG